MRVMRYFLSSLTIVFLAQLVFAQTRFTTVFPGTHLKLLAEKGGRVDWYKGPAHELIAYDAVVDAQTGNTELFLINPDGSDKKCVTCDAPVPKGFTGQPAWHPDGEHIVFQAENSNSGHTLYNHLSWGINQDLWIIRKDGSEAERIFSSQLNHGAMHPHFSKDGKILIFSERVPTGKLLPGNLAKLTPGGENPWDGWRIHIADFNINEHGQAMLSNHRILFGDYAVLNSTRKSRERFLRPNSKKHSGFYETHGFAEDGRIIFSHTEGGAAFVDDIYIADIDGSKAIKLIDSPLTWDEHGIFSPSGKSFAFMSSRADRTWSSKHSRASSLRTELFLKNSSGIHQLTDFNSGSLEHYVVSDLDWDKQGKRIVLEVALLGLPYAQVWMLEFSNPQ